MGFFGDSEGEDLSKLFTLQPLRDGINYAVWGFRLLTLPFVVIGWLINSLRGR